MVRFSEAPNLVKVGLHRHPVQARQILRKLRDGRLVFTPRQDTAGAFYEITGQATYGRLLSGLACPNSVVPPEDSDSECVAEVRMILDAA